MYLTIAVFLLLLPVWVIASGAKILSGPFFASGNDTTLSSEIQRQLNSNEVKALYFPKTVKRFYLQNRFQPVWLKSQSGTGPTWQAMLMIDCVMQFGLSHADYHPHELMYNKLHEILEKPGTINIYEQARFDIMLTDAMVNFINNLHFGKLNPDYPADRIDNGNINGFNTEAVLAYALQQKDIVDNIANVQPRLKEYEALQQQMQLVTGQYTGDCYEVPEADIRRMAANMERLRWAGASGNSYIQVNIPSYTLKLHEPDSVYTFKVIVGKPGNPTPELGSAIGYFTTAPEWKVPGKIFRHELLPRILKDSSYLENNHFAVYDRKENYIEPNEVNFARIQHDPQNYHITQSSGCDNALGLVVFRFPNIYNIYLHDTPEQQLFEKKDRDFSHGCIRVENAEKLAALLLKNDSSASEITALHRSMTARRTRTFVLKKPVPIIITYLTCEMQNGELVTYRDVYDLDNRLEMALYNTDQQFKMR